MDLIRSSVKVLFHDFSIEALARILKEKYLLGIPRDVKTSDEDFLDRLCEGLRWREDKFTTSEIEILLDWIKDELLTDESAGISESAYGGLALYERVFASLPAIGKKLLDTIGKIPKVKFRHLLRWRDLTILTGEDIITLATAAREDVATGYDRRRFCWPNILRHDNVVINHILSGALSDTHAHLWASTDVFEFNWLVAMNHPDVIQKIVSDRNANKMDFLEKGSHQYYDRVNRWGELNLPLGLWIVVAAVLRIRIFNLLHGYENLNINEVADLAYSEFPGDMEKYIDEFRSHLKFVDQERILKFSGSDSAYFDYAILVNDEKTDTSNLSDEELEDVASPFMVLAGERKLFYTFFKKYFSNDQRKSGDKAELKESLFKRLAPTVYLYWLIKIKTRREFVQTNNLRGFKNFQNYDRLKNKFVEILSDQNKSLVDDLTSASIRFAIQSSVLGKYNNHFEVRVQVEYLAKVRECDYTMSIFGKRNHVIKEGKDLAAVLMFIKKRLDKTEDGELRDKELRDELDKKLGSVATLMKGNSKLPIVGFDAAGDELSVGSDVFAPIFRKLRSMGFSRFTFHVGEDFYDIVHGLRSIDEAVRFLELGIGCRIGHGLALGVDARKYYQERHNNAVMPVQVALDNVVWVKYTAMRGNIALNPQTVLFIEEQFARLTEKLGLNDLVPNLMMYHYWEAMNNRCKDYGELVSSEKSKQWEKILDHYWHSKTAYDEGRRTCSLELPEFFWRDVERLQEYMLKDIEHKGLTIETNPSSNLRIGPFSKYSELPLFRFNPPGNKKGVSIPVTVNTDDKGVFATSLENEYSLVAIALRKQRDANGERKWNDSEIEDYLRQLAAYGEMTRFQANL